VVRKANGMAALPMSDRDGDCSASAQRFRDACGHSSVNERHVAKCDQPAVSVRRLSDSVRDACAYPLVSPRKNRDFGTRCCKSLGESACVGPDDSDKPIHGRTQIGVRNFGNTLSVAKFGKQLVATKAGRGTSCEKNTNDHSPGAGQTTIGSARISSHA